MKQVRLLGRPRASEVGRYRARSKDGRTQPPSPAAEWPRRRRRCGCRPAWRPRERAGAGTSSACPRHDDDDTAADLDRDDRRRQHDPVRRQRGRPDPGARLQQRDDDAVRAVQLRVPDDHRPRRNLRRRADSCHPGVLVRQQQWPDTRRERSVRRFGLRQLDGRLLQLRRRRRPADQRHGQEHGQPLRGAAGPGPVQGDDEPGRLVHAIDPVRAVHRGEPGRLRRVTRQLLHLLASLLRRRQP